MGTTLQYTVAAISLAGGLGLCPLPATAADQNHVRTRAGQSLEQLEQQNDHTGLTIPDGESRRTADDRGGYPPHRYLIGKGQGDLAKGPVVCRRVAELSARADLAKQIRILVKEHMVDRLRERTGRDPEQDIEITREEIVQEYLQGVRIIDRQTDEAHRTCSATAVMPKSQIQPEPAPDLPERTPALVR